MTYDEILDFEYDSREHGKISLRHYFYLLLFTLWKEGEGFSGKRPFGNSCWEYDIYEILVKAGAVRGEFDYDETTGECYGLASVDEQTANHLVFNLIERVFGYGDGEV